ncbi:hypothetical protein GLOIN_2v1784016 [Rhizophagus clarus]|nr:hypothetical protein GLOIN_2v1784016 [Rhizophagus clarus]
MVQYSKAIPYFTKANIIDPENIHNLNQKAIVYYILQEYSKDLSDLNEIIQLDSSNSSAYYLKYLIIYHTKNDIILIKKYTELLKVFNSDDNLTKIQFFHLEYLLNKNSPEDLNNIHSDFCTYLYEVCKINKCNFTKLGTINEFNKYMYKENMLYFVSNLMNLNSELWQFQESDISSTSNVFDIMCNCYPIWKINVKKILSKDCFIKFTVKDVTHNS